MKSDEYNTECPHCGGAIKLRSFVGSCDIAVQPGGWCYTDGPCDSSEEEFACDDCRMDIPSDYVFKVIGKAKARKLRRYV